MLLSPGIIFQGLATGDLHSLLPVFLLLVFNEIGLPLPVVYESLLLYSGYQLAGGHYGFFLTAVFGAVGSTLGASLVYWFFRLSGPAILESRFLAKSKERIEVLKGELSRREVLATTVGRLAPGLVGITGAVAGILKLHYLKFLLGVVFSNLVWSVIMISLGFFFGETSERFSGKITLFIGLVSLAVFAFLFKKLLTKIRRPPN